MSTPPPWPADLTWAEVEAGLTDVIAGMLSGGLQMPADADGLYCRRVTGADVAGGGDFAAVIRCHPHGRLTPVAALVWQCRTEPPPPLTRLLKQKARRPGRQPQVPPVDMP